MLPTILFPGIMKPIWMLNKYSTRHKSISEFYIQQKNEHPKTVYAVTFLGY